jgi:hypothetical protein
MIISLITVCLMYSPKNWRFVLLTVDKTERVCKSRGNRYASLLGANVCGCDFTDFGGNCPSAKRFV